MQHTGYDLRATSTHMWFRQIQSKSVVKGYYHQNFSPDAELKYWCEFFMDRTQRPAKDDGYAINSPQTNIKIALKYYLLNNVFKCKAMTATSWSAKTNLAVHVEFEKSMIEVGAGYLRNVIQGKEFEIKQKKQRREFGNVRIVTELPCTISQ
eukprot:1235745-Ditylum_brightwellii.AAC.1